MAATAWRAFITSAAGMIHVPQNDRLSSRLKIMPARLEGHGVDDGLFQAFPVAGMSAQGIF